MIVKLIRDSRARKIRVTTSGKLDDKEKIKTEKL